MANTAEVAKYFRKKTSSGFSESITYLGAQQRFVEALKNSNANNLEEQLLLGTDCDIESYEDNEGNFVQEKSFRKDGALNDYYKIITTIYGDDVYDRNYYYDENQLMVSGKQVSVDTANQEILLNDSNYFAFVEDQINITPFITHNNREFYYNGNIMVVLGEKIEVNESNQEIEFNDPGYFTYGEDDNISIIPTTFKETQTDELFYVDKNNNNIAISVKSTGTRFSNNGRQIIREKITNLL